MLTWNNIAESLLKVERKAAFYGIHVFYCDRVHAYLFEEV